jgi:uncharacterized membrane protein YfcA
VEGNVGAVSFKGVIIGGIVDVVASVVLGLPFAIYTVSRLDLSVIPKNQVGTTVTAAIHANVPLYVGQLLVGLACSVLGGYVAAWLAKRHELLNGALSSFLCVILGVYVLASGQDSNPHWLQACLLAASPALALVGGDLMRRQRQEPTTHSLHL